jgi:DNA-binding transcriptional MocR family regulator
VAVTRHGSGTVIRSVIPAASGASAPAVAALLARPDLSAPLIDLSVGGPDFDDLVRDLTVSGSALPQRTRAHGYVPLGWPELRELVAQLLSRHGAPTSPDEVLITNGAQEAISLAIGLVASDGRRIAIESPGYPSALDAIVRAGGQPLAVERDAGGLRVDSLKQLLERHHVHALYIAPSCNNPTGGRTVAHRRERIAALAADHELTVIEDTVLDELRFDGDPGTPLWALQPERVFAAGSLSKVAWGGLRVGWLRAPRPVILRLARTKGALNIGVGAFDQLAALAILED